MLQTPGRKVQSVAQASFDAWVKYYRQDENTANATVSYYTKGSLVALCLDLSLRQGGKTSLDAVMRALWQRCQGGPMTQDDVLAVLTNLSDESFTERLQQWVHGTDELSLKSLLEQHGVCYKEESASRPEQLGLKLNEHNGLFVKTVLRGSAAEQAGFAAGDEWLAVSVSTDPAGGQWRVHKLDDLSVVLGTATTCQALIARDQRLMTLALTVPDTVRSVKLSVADPAQVATWLAPQEIQKT